MALGDRRGENPRTLQVNRWRGRADVVVVTPMPGGPGPGPQAVAATVRSLASRGVGRILTTALHAHELEPFQINGFVVHERLHLLRHDLRDLPEVPLARTGEWVRLRRCWRRDIDAVLAVDGRAFDGFWSLDRRGLDDAVRATPTSRHRVACGPGNVIVGYAVTGRAADRGYLQRLAVDPAAHRSGIGRALVTDALAWLGHRGSTVAVVNTQEHNAGALALYESCGFILEPEGLSVLYLDLGPQVGGETGEPGPDLGLRS